jgi:hypothetical protein
LLTLRWRGESRANSSLKYGSRRLGKINADFRCLWVDSSAKKCCFALESAAIWLLSPGSRFCRFARKPLKTFSFGPAADSRWVNLPSIKGPARPHRLPNPTKSLSSSGT